MIVIHYRKTLIGKGNYIKKNIPEEIISKLYDDDIMQAYSYGNMKYVDVYTNKRYLALLDGYCIYGGRFLSGKDILALYENGEIDNISKMQGSFNVFIYDILSKKMFVKTDQYGTRMLFYSDSSEHFSIASRLYDLTKYFSSFPELSNTAKQEYFLFNKFIQNSKTLIKDHYVFPTNMSLILDKDRVKWNEYALPVFNYDAESSNLEMFTEQWRAGFDIMLDDFKDDMITVPLSAGLDSRAILAELANRNMHDRVRAITFSHPKSFELNIAKKVAKTLGIKHDVIAWTQKDVIDYQDLVNNVITTDGMIGSTPYIPTNLYRKLNINSIWSGFSGDPLMGSHTLDRSIVDSKISLAELCYSKYKSLNRYEIKVLKIDFEYDRLKKEIARSTQNYNHLNLVEGFDAWYMQNRNRFTTQAGVTGNRDQFEYIFPFFFVAKYAQSSRLAGRYHRADFIKYANILYPEAYSIPSSQEWPFRYRALSKASDLATKKLLMHSIESYRLPQLSYKFSYENLIAGSKEYRNKLFEYIASSDNNNNVKSMDNLIKYLDAGKISYSFIDSLVSYNIIKTAFLEK